MQEKIDNDIHLAKTVTPVKIIGESKAIDTTTSAFDNGNKKVQKTKRLIKQEITMKTPPDTFLES